MHQIGTVTVLRLEPGRRMVHRRHVVMVSGSRTHRYVLAPVRLYERGYARFDRRLLVRFLDRAENVRYGEGSRVFGAKRHGGNGRRSCAALKSSRARPVPLIYLDVPTSSLSCPLSRRNVWTMATLRGSYMFSMILRRRQISIESGAAHAHYFVA